MSGSSTSSAPPPSYEEHVMHYPAVDRMHYPQYHPVLYNDYDPEGSYLFFILVLLNVCQVWNILVK